MLQRSDTRGAQCMGLGVPGSRPQAEGAWMEQRSATGGHQGQAQCMRLWVPRSSTQAEGSTGLRLLRLHGLVEEPGQRIPEPWMGPARGAHIPRAPCMILSRARVDPWEVHLQGLRQQGGRWRGSRAPGGCH